MPASAPPDQRPSEPATPRAAALLRRVVFGLCMLLAAWLVLGLSDFATPRRLARTPALSAIARAYVTVTSAGAPITGAEVRAIRMGVVGDGEAAQRVGSRVEASVTTDAEGLARFDALPEGAYWIAASAPGLARASTSLALTVSTPAEINLSLAAERAVRVEVVDETDAPYLDARIEARGEDPFPVAARSDEMGHALLRGLGGERVRLRVQADGYEDVVIGSAKTGAPPGAGAESEQPVVRVVLKKLGRLDVVVLATDGSRAVGAEVRLSSPVLWPPRSTVTKDQGEAHLLGLPFGSYVVQATLGAASSRAELGVVVAPGEATRIVLRLEAGHFVMVRVIESERENPVQNAQVSLVEGGLSGFPMTATTDKDGRVRLGPFLGSASVSVMAEEFVARNAVPVASPGEELVVALERGGTVYGQVVDSQGRGIDNADIRVVGTDARGQPVDEDPRVLAFRAASFGHASPRPLVASGELGVVPGPVPAIPHAGDYVVSSSRPSTVGAMPRNAPWVSDAAGRFTAFPVSPGRMMVLASHPEYVEGHSEWVQVAPEGRHELRVVLERGGVLEGRVVDAKGRGVGGALVRLASRTDTRQVSAAEDGSFSFTAVPAHVVLTGALFDAPGDVLGRVEIDLEEGVTKKVVLTLEEPREPIVVRVEDERGRAVEFAQVTAQTLSVDVQRKTTGFTEDRGEVELRGLRGLPVLLELRAPGFAPTRRRLAAAGERVVVAMATAERIEGEVRSYRGERIANAQLAFETPAGTRSTLTDAEGHYSLGELEPGSLTVRVRAEGYAPAVHVAHVSAERGRRATTQDRIELEPEAVILGSVVDARGQGVAAARVGAGLLPSYLAEGKLPQGVVLTERDGSFRLGALPGGALTLEAFAVGVGRGRVSGVRTERGRELRGVRIVLEDADDSSARRAEGSVAVTLGQSGNEVVVVQLPADGNAARAGLQEDDHIVAVQGQTVETIEAARARLDGALTEDVVLRVRRGEQELSLRIKRETVQR